MGTAIVPRNFTMTSEDQIRALINGPPAYMRRKRQIEDLEDYIVRGLGSLERGTARQPETLRWRLDRTLVRLNELIAIHNRYYPTEANLRIDLSSGHWLENGKPWSPMPPVTIDVLRQRLQSSHDSYDFRDSHDDRETG